MENSNEQREDVSVSARIPKSVVVAAVSAVLVGVLGIGSTLPERVESKALEQCYAQADAARASADRADNTVSTLARSFETASTDFGVRISRNETKIEKLQSDVFEWSFTCYSKKDADDAEREHTRIHDELLRANEQLQRAIASLEREVDNIKRNR